jgi:hypothetical protein
MHNAKKIVDVNTEGPSPGPGWTCRPSRLGQCRSPRPSAASTRASSVKSPINTRTGSGSYLMRVGTASTPREATNLGLLVDVDDLQVVATGKVSVAQIA